MGKLFGSPSPTSSSSNSSKTTKLPSSARGRERARRSAHKNRPQQKVQPEPSLLGDLISATSLQQESDFQYSRDNMLASGGEEQPPEDLLAGLDLMGDNSSLHQQSNVISLSPQSGDVYHQDSLDLLSPQSSQQDLLSNGSTMNLMDTDLMATNEVFFFKNLCVYFLYSCGFSVKTLFVFAIQF